MFVYSMTVDDPKMTSDIIRVIDHYQDRQNYSTNVKAQMTEWKMQEEDGFKDLCHYVKNAVHYASIEKYKKDFEPSIISMWGLKYKSCEYALEHDHYPATWATAYYLNPPEGCPGIEFKNGDGSWFEMPVHHGLLLVFEGNTTHRVPKKEFVGDRYVVSSNVVFDFNK